MFPSKGRDGTSANTDQYGKTFNCKKLSDTSAHLTHAVSIRGDEQGTVINEDVTGNSTTLELENRFSDISFLECYLIIYALICIA